MFFHILFKVHYISFTMGFHQNLYSVYLLSNSAKKKVIWGNEPNNSSKTQQGKNY